MNRGTLHGTHPPSYFVARYVILAEDVEEVTMNERDSLVSAASTSDDGSESDSSSEEVPPPPPPPQLFDVEEQALDDDEIEEEVVDDDEDGVVEEVIVDEAGQEEEDEEEEEEEEVLEVVEGDHDHDGEEEEVVSVSDQGSEYGEQVVESWQDVIEEEPEDLEAAVTALIAVVYKGEDVDVERYVHLRFVLRLVRCENLILKIPLLHFVSNADIYSTCSLVSNKDVEAFPTS